MVLTVMPVISRRYRNDRQAGRDGMHDNEQVWSMKARVLS